MYTFSITLSEGHIVSVTNDGNMTEVKNEIQKPGQQSVSGSSFNTGPLVTPPKYVKSKDSLLIVLESASQRYQVQIKGGNMSTGHFTLDADDLDEMPSTSS